MNKVWNRRRKNQRWKALSREVRRVGLDVPVVKHWPGMTVTVTLHRAGWTEDE